MTLRDLLAGKPPAPQNDLTPTSANPGRRSLLAAALLTPWLLSPGLALARALNANSSFALYGSFPSQSDIQRLLAAGPPAAVLLYCLVPQKLLGWPFTLSQEAQAELAPAWRHLPHLGRLSGRGSTLSLETLLALKPDLIIDTGTLNDLYRSSAERTAKQTGVPYLLIDGDIRLSANTLRALGRLLGVEARGETLALKAQSILDQAQALRLHYDTTGQAPSFYMSRGADGLETTPRGSIHAQALELCGLRNVVPPLGGSGLGRISPEQLLLWDPDYLFTHDPVFHATAQQAPQWSRLRAVREGRFILVPGEPFGWLDMPPGMNRLLGVHWVSQALVPGATAAATQEAVREVFTLFYQTPPSTSLLDAAARLHA